MQCNEKGKRGVNMKTLQKCSEWMTNHKALLISGLVILGMAFMALITYKFSVAQVIEADPSYAMLKKLYWGMTAGIFAEILVMWFFHFIRHRKLAIEKVAMITVAFWGLVFMLLLPPFSAADEDTTYVSCYALSNTLLGKQDANEEDFVYMRSCDVYGLLHRKPGRNDYRTVVSELLTRPTAEEKEMVLCSIQKMDAVFWNFLPQAIGISIARLLGLGQIGVLYSARLVNFLVFLALFWFACKRMPVGKHILFVIACFPMTLEQISSMSYDALVLGLSFYFIALVLDLVYRKESVSTKDIILMIITMVLLAPTKVIYCMLSLLCFLIPREKFGTKKRYLATIAVMVIAVSASILSAQSGRFAEYIKGSNATISYSNDAEQKLMSYEEAVESGAISEDETALYTFSIVFHNIPRMVAILGNTIRLQSSEYVEQMFGRYLGWLEIDIPQLSVMGFFVIFISLMLKRREDPVPTGVQKADFLLVTVIVIGLAYLFMLVGHTYNGAEYCMGVQGRYFLPVLPLVPMIFWSGRTTVGKKPMVTLENEKEGSTSGFFRTDFRYWHYIPTLVLMINMLLTWTYFWVFARIATRIGVNV